MSVTSPGSIGPRSCTRRSPIYRTLATAGARFHALGDAAVVSGFGDTRQVENEAIRRLALADLSPLPRTGFKGRAMADWLEQQGIKIGEASNRAYPCGRGSLALRLAAGEVLILGSRDGGDDLCGRLDDAWSENADMVLPVPRGDGTFWYTVSGDRTSSVFAKLCGVDLRPSGFDNRTVAQTSVARISAIVVRDDIDRVPCYDILGDVASAGSMWSYLTDAMVEFDGRLVGINALSSLTNEIAG